MKIKLADYPNWKQVEEKQYINQYFNNEEFKGNVSLLKVIKVKERIVKEKDGIEVVAFDDDFKFLEIYPENNKNVAWHATINDKDEILYWYFDVAKDSSVTNEGVPYIEDLYLDLLWYPNGEYKLEDEDELQQALDEEKITKEEYDLAYKVVNKIIEQLEGNTQKLIEFTNKYYKLVNKK